MATARALATPFSLKLTTVLFVGLWTIVAAFPLFWIAIMSFKLPVDAFASNPLQVVFGFVTQKSIGGLSFIGLALGAAALAAALMVPLAVAPRLAKSIGGATPWLGWLAAIALCAAAGAALLFVILPLATQALEAAFRAIPGLDALAKPLMGFTGQHYEAVWFKHAFYKQFVNSLIVTFGVVTISLTVGTLAGYGLARSGSNLAFWILIVALIFRALPHSVLVTGYLPVFIESREIFAPLWQWPATGWFFRLFSDEAPTLYGSRLAVIAVLVSINQPFTIWMLRSFFRNIPSELDEAARVDGCSHFGAFWRVIVPVMWPGVITTGLFSFLLAYNDYLVTSLLLDAQSQTMVPAISQYFNRETTATDQVEAIAAAVSITAPLFLLVMIFQRQIVSGLTQGAVKG